VEHFREAKRFEDLLGPSASPPRLAMHQVDTLLLQLLQLLLKIGAPEIDILRPLQMPLGELFGRPNIQNHHLVSGWRIRPQIVPGLNR